jgi:hypothetical protein
LLQRCLPLVFVLRIFAGIKLLRELKERYDVCQMLYLKYEYMFLINRISRTSDKLLTYVYGFSFVRIRIKKFFRVIYDKADYIMFANASLMEEFHKRFDRAYEKKTGIYPHSLKPLETIDRIIKTETAEESREKLGISKDVVTVVCGSNAIANQQHKKLIRALIEKEYDRKKIIFIFPLTYGSVSYRDRIIKFIKKNLSGYETRIFTDFMSDEDLARLRRVIDVCINVQIMDQLSGAMLESLYSGSVVITGAWLKYQDLDDIGVYMHTVDDFKELPLLVGESIDDPIGQKRLFADNPKLIGDKYNRADLIDRWLELYSS